MFTGIITDIGKVRRAEKRGDTFFEISTRMDISDLTIGASVACSGACMTVTETGDDWFAFLASAETLSRTTMGEWSAGTEINLERAMKAGDEFGGHIVSGHVDGVARVVALGADGESRRVEVEAPERLASFIAEKGSVTVDGVSLTVNSVDGPRFSVNLVPHTLSATTLDGLEDGSAVNLEIDMVARYVARLLGKE